MPVGMQETELLCIAGQNVKEQNHSGKQFQFLKSRSATTIQHSNCTLGHLSSEKQKPMSIQKPLCKHFQQLYSKQPKIGNNSNVFQSVNGYPNVACPYPEILFRNKEELATDTQQSG